MFFWLLAPTHPAPPLTWTIMPVDGYLSGPLSLAAWNDRLAHEHETGLHFPGFMYVSRFTDAAAPAPFASMVVERIVQIDNWLLTLLSAIPLALYLLSTLLFVTLPRQRAAARFRRGLCPTCGYDLRAHTPGQSCPECATPIEPKP
jgi:hypothetical protein